MGSVFFVLVVEGSVFVLVWGGGGIHLLGGGGLIQSHDVSAFRACARFSQIFLRTISVNNNNFQNTLGINFHSCIMEKASEVNTAENTWNKTYHIISSFCPCVFF